MPHLPFGLSVPERQRLEQGRGRGREIAGRTLGFEAPDLTDEQLAKFIDLEGVSAQERTARTAIRQAPGGHKAAARAPLALEQFLRGQEGARATNILQGGTARPAVRFGGEGGGQVRSTPMALHQTPRAGTLRTPAGQRGFEQEPSFRELGTSNPFTALEETLAGRTERGQDLQRGEFNVQTADPAFEERLTSIQAQAQIQAAREQAGGQIGAAEARGPILRPTEEELALQPGDPRTVGGALDVLGSEFSDPSAREAAMQFLLQVLKQNAPEG